MPLRQGRKSASQTPTPKSERIYGSEKNPKGSASSSKSAKNITFSDKTIKALQNKLDEFKEKHKGKKNITLGDLKAVYRRGSGAYSNSHRPGISRNGWAMARVNKFLLKAGGTKVKAAYVQDDDLMKMHLGGDMSKHLAPNGKPSNLTRFEEGGEIKNENGYLKYTIEDDEVIINNIKVYKQRLGIGKKLINQLKKIARDKDLPITLYAYPQDETINEDDLNDFYYSQGFELHPEDVDGKLFIYGKLVFF
jgi:hypothetical protein